MYEVGFSRQSSKDYEGIADRKILKKLDIAFKDLKKTPYPNLDNKQIKLKGKTIADYRKTVGLWRILYDVYEKNKKVLILRIRRRNEKTYR